MLFVVVLVEIAIKSKISFAPNIVETVTNIDEQIKNLNNYLKGDLKDYEYMNPGSEEISYSYGKQQRCQMFGAYKVYSTETSYYFSFYYCKRDDEDKNNVGVWNLLIQETPNGDEIMNSIDSWDEWKNGTKYRGITLND